MNFIPESPREARRPLIIAHRGLAHSGVESSLEAFRDAVDAGCDMVEFDVRRTADGRFVVMHDAKVGGSATSSLDFEDLRARCDSQGVGMSSLADVLATVPSRVQLDIELKESGYEREVIEYVLEDRPPSAFVVTSFLDESICAVRAAFPDVRTGLLVGRARASARQRVTELFPWWRMRRCFASFVAPHYRLLRLGFLRRMRWRDVPVYVWTVNDEARLRTYVHDSRIAGIVTDRPKLAMRLRDGRD